MAQLTMEQLKAAISPLIREVSENVVKQMVGNTSGSPWVQALFTGSPKREGPGDPVGALVRATAASALRAKSGEQISPERVAESWGYNGVARMITDGREKAMSAGNPLAGGTLVPEQFAQEVVEQLRPISVVRKMNPTVLPMPVGSIKISKVTSGSTAYYIGENAAITKTQLATGQITLTSKKLAALVPISNDLLRYSSPAADIVVRDDMVRAIAEAENTHFLRGDGMAGTPKGLRYQAASGNIVKANVTVSVANAVADLSKLVRLLMAGNSRLLRPGWIISPRTYMWLVSQLTAGGAPAFAGFATGTLLGFPYGISTGLPEILTDGGNTDETEIYFCDFADVVIGEGLTITVDISQEATYLDGGVAQSAFSLDQSVVRVITAHDLAVRRAESVAFLNQVRWGI